MDAENGHPNPDLLASWINALIEGQLAPAETRKLEQLVCRSSDVRRFYVRYLHLHGCLQLLATSLERLDDVLGADPSPSAPDRFVESSCMPAIRGDEAETEAEAEFFAELNDIPPLKVTGKQVLADGVRRRFRWAMAIAAAAVLIIACTIIVPLLIRGPAVGTAQFATLVESVGAKWKGGAPDTGPELTPNASLELAEGLTRLKFAGADLIIEAPARFTVISGNRIQLSQGTLWAQVSSASGFEVVTPGEIVKDLGTEFGVQVLSGETSVHVFQGRVAVSSKLTQAAQLILNTGEATVFDSAGKPEPKSIANPAGFVRPTEFAAAVAANRLPDRRQELLDDPSLVAHFTFAEVDGKPALNPSDGAVDAVGRQLLFGNVNDPQSVPTIVPGRQAGRPAIRFDPRKPQFCEAPGGVADPFDFSNGGKGPGSPLTVAVWLRAAPVKSGSGADSYIINRGGAFAEQYALNILDGRFHFTVSHARGAISRVDSGVAPDGQWHLLVGTFEPASRRMSFYVDGRLCGRTHTFRELWQVKGLFRIGCSAGTISTASNSTLDGTVDEVILWRRALSGAEINSFYHGSM